MTREEILQKAKEDVLYIANTSQTKEEAVIGGYCLGAKLADKMMLERLDRACELLSIYYPNINRMGIYEFVNIFRKAVEG